MKTRTCARTICLTFAILLGGMLMHSSLLAGAKIKLSMVSFVPKMNITYRLWDELFAKKVNGKNGEVSIRYRGGPEVVAPYDLAKMVSRGFVDMAIIPTSLYPSVVPGADTMRLSMLTTAEERSNGVYDLQREIHAQAGLYFLGNLSPMRNNFFWVVLSKPVNTKADFQGLKLGGTPPFLHCFRSLGTTPVRASLKEYYTMVERGVLAGNIVGLDVYLATGEYEVAPYIIDHPIYRSTNVVIINLKKWNSLSDSAKKLLTDSQIEYEKTYPDAWDRALKGMKHKAVENGAKFLKLQPEVAEWYNDTFHQGGWTYTEKKFPKEVVSRFKKLISK